MPRIAAALGVILLLLTAVSATRAEDSDIMRRLRSEPITLFDWGMAQLERDIVRAAAEAVGTMPGMGDARAAAGTLFDWRTDRITLYAAYPLPPELRTDQTCTDIFQNIVATLTTGAPRGPSAPGWYLRNAFQPKGHYWAGRFENVEDRLMELVRLEVTLNPTTFEAIIGDTRRVRCVGRLDAGPREIEIAGRP